LGSKWLCEQFSAVSAAAPSAPQRRLASFASLGVAELETSPVGGDPANPDALCIPQLLPHYSVHPSVSAVFATLLLAFVILDSLLPYTLCFSLRHSQTSQVIHPRLVLFFLKRRFCLAH
jgi:hypothetical protein